MVILIGIIIYILYKSYMREQPVEPAAGTSAPLVAYANQLDKRRLVMVGSLIAVLYSLTFSWFHFVWYRLYKQSAFHWFDDRKEWNQFDKTGHFFAGYFQTVWAYELLRWAGVENKRAALTAGFLGMSYISSVEIWDGYSEKWGASWSDLTANAAGAMLAMSQYLLWEEQRIMVKYSYEGGTYPEGELNDRANELFGKTFLERALKDYNHMTVWLSINPSKFVPGTKLPKWTNIAIGYGVENMYGGFENKWIDKDGKQHDRTDLPRNRILKLSLDADLPRLRQNDPNGKAVFGVLNLIKMPFPSYKIII